MDDYLTQLMLARHLQQEPWMNKDNPGAGLTHQVSPDLSAIGGYYKNTLGKPSFYAGAEYMPIHAGNFSAGVDAGAVTGYPKMPVAPMVAPTATYDFGHGFGGQATLMPDPTNLKHSAIGLQMRYKIGGKDNIPDQLADALRKLGKKEPTDVAGNE